LIIICTSHAARLVLTTCALLAAAGCATTVSGPPPPPLPAEHLTVTTLAPSTPHRLYILDVAFANEIDARVHLLDGDTYRRLGQIDAGFTPGFTLSPEGKTTAVGTTYFARGSRGKRTDVVEFTDNTTLAVTHEIVLPAKRAMTLPSYFNLAYSADSHFLYVAYVTPAASFGVLDPSRDQVLDEIDTAGCVLVIPSGPNRVSSICESGQLLTVTLDAAGHEASRSLSEAFFDPDADPVFVQGVPMKDGFTFLSFLGKVHEVDLAGAQPVFRAPWSLVSAAEQAQGWRPGGTQVGAIHKSLSRLFVAMHRGGEGSHKDPGSEIWVFDMKTHERLARWPLATYKLAPGAVQVSQDEAPILFAATDRGDVAVLDAVTGKLRHIEKAIGQTLWFLMTP
jgi:methylamine dehydrogenase heavy chain